jgi:hypothetical protein
VDTAKFSTYISRRNVVAKRMFIAHSLRWNDVLPTLRRKLLRACTRFRQSLLSQQIQILKTVHSLLVVEHTLEFCGTVAICEIVSLLLSTVQEMGLYYVNRYL